jgi:hypothetical protein
VTAGAPQHLPLDLSGGQEVDASRVSVPLAWKRLQFKHATANNGRRKGLQQHYVVQINLLGKTDTGEYIKIAEIQSGPVIVRGRSPRNFDSRKDVPLSGDKKGMDRRSASASAVPTTAADFSPALKADRETLSQNLQKYHSLGNVQGGASEWGSPQPYGQQHATKKMAVSSPNLTRPPVPSWGSSEANTPTRSSSLTPTPSNNAHRAPSITSVPLNLSLTEDERSPKRSSSELHSPQLSRASTSNGPVTAQSPMETADMLYEYFPLSLDDW